MKKILFFFILSFTVQADDLKNFISLDLAMVNTSYTESESNLKKDESSSTGETTAPGSGSSSIISIDFTYNIPIDFKKVVFFRALSPLMPTGGTGLVYGGGGMNYFWNGLSSRVSSSSSIVKFETFTKWKFYVGGSAGFGYLIYLTETAKKTDILFELGIQGGGIMEWKDRWGVKGEVYIGRGVGTVVSATDMQLIIGPTYTF